MNTEWKPIASAPKDGTEILAWRHDCGQFIASYTSADAFPMTQDELDAWDEETLFAKDWFTQWPQALRLEGSEVPTLWQPMPTDPCATCNGHGMIGGPSFYAPDEGGEPCPDCSPPAPTSHPIPTGATGEDDIVQRLRNNADLDAAEDGNPAVIRLEREAADEIDRLRRALVDAPSAGHTLIPLGALNTLLRAFVIAVENRSPFARQALAKADASIAQQKGEA
jgi:hypothetical protein